MSDKIILSNIIFERKHNFICPFLLRMVNAVDFEYDEDLNIWFEKTNIFILFKKTI